jgi:hypothetical protein
MPSALPADRLDAAARGALAEVLRALAAPRRAVDACAEAFGRIRAGAAAGGRELRREDLALLAPLLREALASLPAGVDGTGVVTAPGLVAGESLWLEWWRRGADGAPEALRAALHPDDPAYFDYPAAEWFRVPRDRGIPWIAGPFVDRGGTNRHLCTLSVPVSGEDGEFLGIAGADLRVGYVERLARRALPRTDDCALLVNREARVLASDDPRWPAGALLAAPAAGLVRGDPGARGTLREGGGAIAWDTTLPWGVAVLPRALLSAEAR